MLLNSRCRFTIWIQVITMMTVILTAQSSPEAVNSAESNLLRCHCLNTDYCSNSSTQICEEGDLCQTTSSEGTVLAAGCAIKNYCAGGGGVTVKCCATNFCNTVEKTSETDQMNPTTQTPTTTTSKGSQLQAGRTFFILFVLFIAVFEFI